MKVWKQIETAKIVCPVTKRRLKRGDDPGWLETEDGSRKYPFLNGVPDFLSNPQKERDEFVPSEVMKKGYLTGYATSLKGKLLGRLFRDYRSPNSIKAVKSVFGAPTSDEVYLSVGGGPLRTHPNATNLNIGPFPNVDVIADAHQLPYADKTVKAIFCEAVLEHLQDPHQAVGEMFRVLNPGGRVFAATPFLAPYHGYPHHYQNFTLTGHRHLFEKSGFTIIDEGTCVGPVYTILNLSFIFIRHYSPRFFRLFLQMTWAGFALLLGPLDRLVNERSDAHVLASTTYLVAEKRKPVLSRFGDS